MIQSRAWGTYLRLVPQRRGLIQARGPISFLGTSECAKQSFHRCFFKKGQENLKMGLLFSHRSFFARRIGRAMATKF